MSYPKKKKISFALMKFQRLQRGWCTVGLCGGVCVIVRDYCGK